MFYYTRPITQTREQKNFFFPLTEGGEMETQCNRDDGNITALGEPNDLSFAPVNGEQRAHLTSPEPGKHIFHVRVNVSLRYATMENN